MFKIILVVVVMVGGSMFGQQEFSYRGGPWDTLDACEEVLNSEAYHETESRFKDQLKEYVKQQLEQDDEAVEVITESSCQQQETSTTKVD